MTNLTNLFSSSLRILCIHFSLLLFFFVLIYYFSFGNLQIRFFQLTQWDANWYLNIRDNGYFFIEGQQSSTGFFPGFPYFWKFLGLGIIGISLVNFLLFISSFVLLIYFFKPGERTQYLFLSIPCLLFFMVPYSESLFFLFSTLVLIGLKKNNWWLTMIAFVLAGYTRSAATIFIPALIVSSFFVMRSTHWKEPLKEFSFYTFTCITITFLVIYQQYLETDVWFAATKTHKHWDHALRIPELPLRSWGKTITARLDGTSLLVGLASLIILLKIFVSKLKNTYQAQEKYYLFSILYLTGISLSILLFQGGDLHSTNRYIFATPFYFIFLLAMEHWSFSLRKIWIAFFLLTIYWLLFESYQHILTLGYYTLLSVLIILFLLIFSSSEKISRWAFITVYLVSTFCQAYFFVHFLHGMWVG